MSRRGFLVLALLATLLVTPGAVAHHEGVGEPKEAGLFHLFGTAQDDADPGEFGEPNPRNEVLSIDQDGVGGVARNLARNVKIAWLDNQVELKYLFEGGTCGAGAPRISLIIDADGDGQFEQAPDGPDFAAHGHLNPPLFAACPMSVWRFEDLTDQLVRWEVTPATAVPPVPIGPIGGAGAVNWETLEDAVTLAFPDHQVLEGVLVSDSGAGGCAYFDAVSIGARTLTDWSDTRRHRPRGPNTC